jgi:hypothetical protein
MTFRTELDITKHLRLQSVLDFVACALASLVVPSQKRILKPGPVVHWDLLHAVRTQCDPGR